MQRCYTYGAHNPTENEAVVREQLFLANRYRNALIEVARNRHAAKEAVFLPHVERRKAEREALAVSRGVPAKSIILPKLELTPGDKAALATIEEVTKGYLKATYNARGELHWGTACILNDAIQRSMKSGEAPRFRRFDGSGVIAVQLQGGMPVGDLLGGMDTRIRFAGGILRLRIGWTGDDAASPLWVALPIAYHRELPADARVKWVKVFARRAATKIRYDAQFILESDGQLGSPLPKPVRGTVAVDVGWRRYSGRSAGDGLRVAYWTDDKGKHGELRLQERLLTRWEKTQDLQSIRDKHFNETVAWLRGEKSAHGDTWPEWLRGRTSHLHSWKSPNQLYRLAKWWQRTWKAGEFPGAGALYVRLETWRKKEAHLFEWETNQRENVLRARREHYRVFAKFLASYREVVVEKLDLRDFAELPEEGKGEEHSVTAARPRRFLAALSELFDCIEDAVGRAGGAYLKVKPAFTTQTCHVCGRVEKFDAAAKVVHTCALGHTWDQDFNATLNLLRAAKCEESVLERSTAEDRKKAGELASVRVKERVAKMATARRSKKVAYAGDVL